MEKRYKPLIMLGWSDSPIASEGHINDYLPGNKYGENWNKAIENNDFISLYTVEDEEGVRYYKIVYSKEPESAIYIQWGFQRQDVPGCYDAIDRTLAEVEIQKIQERLSNPN